MAFHVGDNFKKISWLTYFITYFNEHLVTILYYFNLKAPQIISFVQPILKQAIPLKLL